MVVSLLRTPRPSFRRAQNTAVYLSTQSLPSPTLFVVPAAESHWVGILILAFVFALLTSFAVIRALTPRREHSEHLELLHDIDDDSE
jgi:hypothetical protein